MIAQNTVPELTSLSQHPKSKAFTTFIGNFTHIKQYVFCALEINHMVHFTSKR